MTRRISNPYEKVAHKTERTNNQKLVQWMNEVIQDKHLQLGSVEQETSGADRKQPDVVIKKRPGSEEILCVIELKPPAFLDPFNETELVEPARTKATRRRAPYFATSNFRELIWFNTERANRLEPLEKQIVQRYTLSSMTDPDRIEEPGIKSAIRRGLERFLIDLAEVSTGQKAEPKHAIDEILVYRLQNTIKALAIHYKQIIEEKVKSDRKFSKQLQTWFIEQGWSFSFQDQDYAKAARQAAYLLVNKILFYSVIQPTRRLDPLQIPKDLTKGSLLEKFLQNFFEEVLKIDYETIYSTDFIDQVAFPENRDVVEEIKEFVEVLSPYDFSRLGYDVIGRIFEKLIPEEERHILGQYFTSPDVVDLILRFCLKHETDKILDPGCGAGTFLVRAYQHKKLMNQRLTHEEILKTIWGNDIAKFPAHLTTINLAINDLRSDENYPRVIRKDFFDLLPDRMEFPLPESWRKIQIKGLGKIEKTLEHPRFFDAIVGNPPYTRQEEIEDIQEKAEGYKDQLIRKALHLEGKPFAEISRRAGIYAYFFIHGTKFLQNGGRFGFIVSNSWLDVDYGKGLQEHFLTHYKIIAIIESKVERWFEDADVNTCIVILEKVSGEKLKRERDEHLVRFAYLKRPLRYFIPPAENMWEKEVGRLEVIDKLNKTVLGHSSYYENEDLRVYPKSQKELWEEGYDPEEGKYVGAKWGKYLRAPKIFFDILTAAKGKIVPLKKLAELSPGCYTGINDFFYLGEDRIKAFKIEPESLTKIVRSTRQVKALSLKTREIDTYVFDCPYSIAELKRKGLKRSLAYIEWGEKQKTRKRQKREAGVIFPHVETVKNRKPGWYAIPNKDLRPTNLFFQYVINDTFLAPMTDELISSDRCFHRVFVRSSVDAEVLWGILNSSLTALQVEIEGRTNLGQGALKFETTDAKRLLVLNPESLDKTIRKQIQIIIQSLASKPVKNIFELVEGGERAELDTILLCKVLNFPEVKVRELYDVLADLVKTRLARAKSLKKVKKTREGLDLDLLAHNVLSRLGEDNLATFYKDRIVTVPCYTIDLPKRTEPIEIGNSLLGWRLNIGKKTVDCSSEAQARYLRVFAEMGWEQAPVPQDDGYLFSIIDQWEDLYEKTQAVLEEYTSSILQRKTRDRLVHAVWAKIRESIEQIQDADIQNS